MQCATCGKPMKLTNLLKYCKSCRTAYNKKQQQARQTTAASPKKMMQKQQQPKSTKVKLPQRQRRSPNKVLETITEDIAKISTDTMQSKVGYSMKPTSKTSGYTNLLKSTLTPDEAQGMAPPNFQIDDIGQQQLPMVADNSFSVNVNSPTQSSILRIAQVASPVITHLLWCNDGVLNIEVLGASTFTVDNNTLAVVGNKLDFLGEYQAPNEFTPSKEYLKFRVLSVSDNIVYNGKAIDVSGNSYTAHIQSALEITDISPYQIADSVRVPMVKSITRIAQHQEPVFEYTSVEESDTPNNSNEVVLSGMYTFDYTATDLSRWSIQAAALPSIATPTLPFDTSLLTNPFDASMATLDTPGIMSQFESYLDAVDRKYGLYADAFKTLTITHSKNVTMNINQIKSDAEGALWRGFIQSSGMPGYDVIEYAEPEISETFRGTANMNGAQAFFKHIIKYVEASSEFANAWSLTPPPNVALPAETLSWATRLGFIYRFKPRVTQSVRAEMYVSYPSVNLLSALLDGNTQMFIDSEYKVALTEYNAKETNINLLITSRQIYQVVVNDRSVLAIQAKRADIDKTAVTDKQMKMYSRICRALPPALIDGEEMRQLQNYGFFGDLASGVAGKLLGNDAANIAKSIGNIFNI